MADHDAAVELFYDATWNGAPVLQGTTLEVIYGAPGEGQESPPTTVDAALDNGTRHYSPLNAISPLYGKVGRNTPLRVTVDGATRATVEVSKWQPRQSGKASAPILRSEIKTGGLLRRLQRGRTPVKSTLSRTMPTLAPVAYWPFEEGVQALQVQSGITTGRPMLLNAADFAFAADDAVAGSAPLPRPGLNAMAEGTIVAADYPPAWATTDRWSVRWLMRVPAAPAADRVVLEWQHTGTIVRYEVVVDTTQTVYVRGYNSANVEQFAFTGIDLPSGGFNGEVLVDRWLAWTVRQVQQPNTLYNVDVSYSIVSDARLGASSSTGTGSAGVVSSANTGRPLGRVRVYGSVEKIGMGHVSVHAIGNSVALTGIPAAANGNAGERAGVRFLRVCDEEGIPAVVEGDEEDTQIMGPQPAGPPLDVLRDCVTTDDGIMFEPRDSIAVGMRTGRSLYNQPAALTLSYLELSRNAVVEPITDDQYTRNEITAKRRSGSTFTATQTTGPLNVNDPADDPDGVGKTDSEVLVNPLLDSALRDHAYWHLAKGTVPDPRYPNLLVDLDRYPALTADLVALKLGDRIELTDLPADWQYDTASLLVIGTRDTIKEKRLTVALVTVPAAVYEVGIVAADDGSVDVRGQAIDTDKSTLDSGVTSSATTLDVISTDGVRWTLNPDDWDTGLHGGGLFLAIGGEKMRVTDITGAGATQAVDVVRSVNGVVKAHAAGTPVHVWSPVRAGL